MNTRNAYKIRSKRGRQLNQPAAPVGLAVAPRAKTARQGAATTVKHPACDSLPARSCRHPLTDGYTNARLAHCEDAVKGLFDHIEPTLRQVAATPFGDGYEAQVQRMFAAELGFEAPLPILQEAWVHGPDMRSLYASCTFSALKSSAARFVDDLNRQQEKVQDTQNFFLDCGFHAVDISPCSDGRLKGLMRYILRLPLSSFARRKAYAGALFDVETDVRDWSEIELRRFREGIPSTPDSGTRYLKIAVYHGSSSDAAHEGCAAHGSNERKAIEAAAERLEEFRQAIENQFCCGASTDILLIGVDTDTDAIRVHIPDAKGNISAHRYVDNAEIYRDTLNFSADAARLAVYEAIQAASRVQGWGAGEGEPHEGMRRFIATLLINNLSQIEYVADIYGGRYPDIGHAERYISVGDGFDEVQMRNIAYYAHLQTLEEGVADMDVGIKIFKGLNIKRGLPVPVAINYRYDASVPGSRERAVARGKRVRDAIELRYAELKKTGMLFCHLSVQDRPTGSELETVEDGL